MMRSTCGGELLGTGTSGIIWRWGDKGGGEGDEKSSGKNWLGMGREELWFFAYGLEFADIRKECKETLRCQ